MDANRKRSVPNSSVIPLMTNQNQNHVTRRRFLQTSAGTAAAATVPATAAAQSDDEDGRSVGETVRAIIAGVRGRVNSAVERGLGERTDSETAATDAKEEFNPNSGEWVAYINDHASLDGDVQVVSLEFLPKPEEEPDDTTTVYLVSDHDGDQYTSAEIVDATSREVDEEVRLESIAADHASEEIETAYEEFVTEDKPPSDEHLAYLAGKYRFGTNHITSTLLGDDL